MTQAMYDEVIYGSTPIECRLGGVHPRLHFTREELAAVRGRAGEEPWRTGSYSGRGLAGVWVSNKRWLRAVSGAPSVSVDAGVCIKCKDDQAPQRLSRAYIIAAGIVAPR